MQQIYLKTANVIQPIFKDNFSIFKRKPIVLLSKYVRWRKCAGLINLSSEGRFRLEWMIFYQTAGKKKAYNTAKHFNISPKTFYKWLHIFEKSKEAVRTLENKSRKPHKTRTWEITLREEIRIRRLRIEHMHWGRKKLRKIYQKAYGQDISIWGTQRVINKYNLYPDKRKKEKLTLKKEKAREKPKKRIGELTKEKTLWFLLQLDGITIYWNGLKRYIFTAVDHAGKFGFARMYKNKSSINAADFLYRLKYAINQPIFNLQTDNGSEFAGVFEKAANRLEIERYFSRTRTPKDNPEVERFNQTLEYEWLYDGNFELDPDRFNKKLTEWLIEYNFERPHQSLNYLTPMEYIVREQKKQKKKQEKRQNLLPMCPDRTFSVAPK